MSFAILNVDGPEIGFGGTGVVRFAVNPSNAYISTSLTDWMLCDVNTGTAAANFTLEGIAPDGAAAGQYTATIRCSTAVETVAALKLNAGSAANPAWVSSSAFKIGIASSSSITMTANKNGNVDITVISTGTKTIDWGDGKAPQTFGSGVLLAYYTYIGSGTTHNIVIDGQNITGLRSHSMQLSKLDVTKSTALTELSCNNNSLTSLDVTKNTALTELKVQSNQFTAAGLNALFGTLHSNAGTKTIYIYGNSGTATCNRTIATDKGWTVDTTTAGDQ